MKYSQVMEQVRTSAIASALSSHPADAIAQVEDAYYQQISSICDMVTHCLLYTSSALMADYTMPLRGHGIIITGV